MPTYEYKCKLCDDRFEVEQRISDDALTTLPGCDEAGNGDHMLRKVFSAIGIAFKGEGFYRNDARGPKKSSSNGNGTSSDSSSSSDSAASESTSSSSSSDSSGSDSSSSSGGSTTKADSVTSS